MATEYAEFLATKHPAPPATGFPVADADTSPHLFPFQRQIVRWAVERGRAALFEERGLGKTLQQLDYARLVCAGVGCDALILAPLVVGAQTVGEGRKFGIPATLCRAQADVRPGINVANYEMLEHFDVARFGCVVLDESSILKAYAGATKQRLVEAFARTPYRLCCTATPSPNDTLELGNHAEFLGIMSSHEMIARWFITDQSAMGRYRLKEHAAADFFAWVASWAMAVRRPSDLGYPDEGYALPPLQLKTLTVPVDLTDGAGDKLFRVPDLNATGLHEEGRRTAPVRARAVADLVNADREAWAIWCNTDYEAAELTARIPDAVEVRGPEKPADKERKLIDFTEGRARVLVTKPRIAGYGLNWQHCARTAFVGLSYSFEQLYQALGRVHRFGQAREVEAWIVAAETEGAIWEVVRRKQAEHERLMAGLFAAGDKLRREADAARRVRYDPRTPMAIPGWLTDTEAA